MKKIFKKLSLLIIISMILTSKVLGVEMIENIEVVWNKVNISVNGEKVEGENILYKGTTYAPLRAVSEILDKEVVWDQKTNMAKINDRKVEDTKKNKENLGQKPKLVNKENIKIVWNKVDIRVNGEKVDVENILYKGRTYAPLRAVSEILDKKVEWNGKTNTASINDKNLIESEELIEKNYLDNLFENNNLLGKEFDKLRILINPDKKNDEWLLKLKENLESIEKIAEDSIEYRPVPNDFIDLDKVRKLSMEEFKKMVKLIEEDLILSNDELLFKAGDHLSNGSEYLKEVVDMAKDLYKIKGLTF